MSLAQENFEAAVESARRTLLKLGRKPMLKDMPRSEVETLRWDLNNIAAALSQELGSEHRGGGPVDIA